MKTKFRYEPPLLVDMKGPALCGEFITCGGGGGVSSGSCMESTSCTSGRGAEVCRAGNTACGCDSCCDVGSGWSTLSGFPFTLCECVWGNQAALSCNDGQYTGSVCANGYTASYACSVGTDLYTGGETNWCNPGSGVPE